MSFNFDFDASPPIDATTFYEWNEALPDEPPCADVGPDGSWLQLHGSWGMPGRDLQKYWPRLKAWADGAGVTLTYTGGEYCPMGFESKEHES